TTSTHLIIDMRSTQLDPVLVLTDSQLKKLDIDDDYDGTCNAHLDETLAAGSYLILANTYTTVSKCGSNQGTYSLTVSDSAQPVLGDTATTGTGTAASALITGGATADGGTTYKSTFAATDSIDVNASIMVDPSQVGQSGKVYVLIQASNGARYSKAGDGSFVPFNGNLSQMTAYKSGSLLAQETVKVASGLKAAGTGLAGLSFVVYVGYALDNQPSTIYYGTTPIQFSIGK
ncbi:MAG TPA: hypothetical protein VMH83_14260, partial [Candidatus Acidoferrum sp.]|nr:hypothetical protein [Candidatus Acidoferrum sp.]